ncbi:hypothetical protein MUK42_34022 [Musa troglodytarum]|uniref:Uncharacterized protein n=1 Tax=Musa troglodytarum TaxID=320322 RepID=A0A9E7EAV2_9LILI|nr:hypothetical protein MUK42_34022 [Musa troglodytarum]
MASRLCQPSISKSEFFYLPSLVTSKASFYVSFGSIHQIIQSEYLKESSNNIILLMDGPDYLVCLVDSPAPPLSFSEPMVIKVKQKE